jgi:hypothetical protein
VLVLVESCDHVDRVQAALHRGDGDVFRDDIAVDDHAAAAERLDDLFGRARAKLRQRR